jgi:hypothetical protein
MVRPGILLLGGMAALAACASSAPTVKSTMQTVADSSSVVIGKFGVYSRYPRSLLFSELQALSLKDGKKWKLPLATDDVGPDGNGVPFFLELPPGKYLLTKWLLVTGSAQYKGENAGVLFELKPGKVSCIGAIYMGRGQPADRSRGDAVFRSGTVVRDECDALATQLKKKAPLLGTPDRTLGAESPQASASPP